MEPENHWFVQEHCLPVWSVFRFHVGLFPAVALMIAFFSDPQNEIGCPAEIKSACTISTHFQVKLILFASAKLERIHLFPMPKSLSEPTQIAWYSGVSFRKEEQLLQLRFSKGAGWSTSEGRVRWSPGRVNRGNFM